MRVPAGTRKQRRLVSVEALDDGRQLEAQRRIRPDHRQPVVRRQMIEPVAQRGDRLRLVAAGDRRRCGIRFAAQVDFGHGIILSRQHRRVIAP